MSVAHTAISAECDSFSPDIIGSSLASVKSLDGAKKISERLRKKNIPLVWGGPFCDVCDPQVILSTCLADYISFSEGEETWLDMVSRLEKGESFDSVQGIAYMKDGRLIKTPDREFIDLALLPELDFTLVDVPAYKQYLYGCNFLVYVYLSKGCPAKCTFCTNLVSHRSCYRRRPLEQFMNTVKLASRIRATQCSFLQYCISPRTPMGQAAMNGGKYKHPIKKLSDYRKVDFFVSRTDNFSEIPKKELEVIQSHYLWKAIFRKDYGEKTKNYDLFFKHIKTLFMRLSFLHFACGVKCFFEIGFLFIHFFCDTHFHPLIYKKYHLD